MALDWDSLLPGSDLLAYQEEIVLAMNKQWNSQEHSHIICPDAEGRTRAILKFILEKKVNVIILVSDDMTRDRWLNAVDEFLPPEAGITEKESFIRVPAAHLDSSPISILSYSSICSLKNAVKEDKEYAKNQWQLELASMDADSLDDVCNIAHLDALREINVWLEHTAIRNMSEYNLHLQRFIQAATDTGVIDSSKWINPNMDSLLAEFNANNVQLVICDNCHKVTGLWAQSVRYLVSHLENAVVFGATSHPMKIDTVNAIDQQIHLKFFASSIIDIPPPSLVRDGGYAPYRYLLHISPPTEEEEKYLKSHVHAYNRLLVDLEDSKKVRICLKDFAISVLSEMENDAPGNWGRRRDLLVSLLHFHLREEISLSSTWAIYATKLNETTFESVLPLIQEYVFTFLLKSEFQNEQNIGKDLVEALQTLGYTFHEKGFEKSHSALPAILYKSTAKIHSLMKVLEQEILKNNDDLKVLIITDTLGSSSILDAYPNSGIHPDSCTGMTIFQQLRLNEMTIRLNPVVVSEQGLILDPRYKDSVMQELFIWSEEMKNMVQFNSIDRDGITEIKASGPAFTQSSWVKILKEMLDNQIIFCLISSRSILAESWNGLQVNTLCDLSTVVTEFACEQLRNRILPADPNDHLPCRHIWDFVSVCTDVQYGYADYDRLVKKKKADCGICTDGEFEFGVSHLHPLLNTKLNDMSTETMEEISLDMLNAIGDRKNCAASWLSLSLEGRQVKPALEIQFYDVLEDFNTTFVFKKEVNNQKTLQKMNLLQLFHGICRTIMESLCIKQKIKYDPEIHYFEINQHQGFFYRVFIMSNRPDIAESAKQCLTEILAPIERQHLILTSICYGEASSLLGAMPFEGVRMKEAVKSGQKFTTLYAIPEMFSEKNDAVLFHTSWCRNISVTTPISLKITKSREAAYELLEDAGKDLKPRLIEKTLWY